MVLSQIIITAFALITLFLGSIFVYYDIKSRSVGNYLFLSMAIFAIIEFAVFGIFQFSTMLIIPALITILAIVVSYYTGNIGMGDLPMIASVLIFLFVIGDTMSYLIIFMVSFMLSFLMMPFILYRKSLSKFEIIIVCASIVATAIILLFYLLVGMVVFLIAIGIVSYIILGEKDKMYKSAVKHMKKEDLVIGDLIENNLLDQEIRVKLGISKTDGLTNINSDIMAKIDDQMKLPIYSNSIPFTVPLLVGFVCVFLAFLVVF